MYVDEQSIPEPLQEMKDESLLAVEEAQAQKIAIEKVKDRANVQWHAVPSLLEPQDTLVGAADEGWGDWPSPGAVSPNKLLHGMHQCIAVMLGNPEGYVFFLFI